MTVIEIPAVFPDGSTFGSYEVRIELDTGSSRPGYTGTTHVLTPLAAYMPTDGTALEVDLEPNAGDMEGSLYRVSVQRTPWAWSIQVPATGGPYLVGDPAIASTGIPGVAYVPGPPGADSTVPGPPGDTTAAEAIAQEAADDVALIAATAVVYVVHGPDEAVVRPDTAAPVMWIGSVVPLNREANDLVVLREADVAPPAVPTGLTATPGVDDVQLAWSAVSDPDLARYEYRVDAGSAVPVGVALAADVNGLVVGTTYAFSVRAVDVWGNASAWSSSVSASPGAIVSDTFTGGDVGDITGRSTDSGLGGTPRTWARSASGTTRLGITSGRLVVASGTSVVSYAVDAGTGTVRAGVRIYSVADAGTSLMTVMIRMASVDATSYYRFGADESTVRLARVVSGTTLALGTARPYVAGDYVEVEAVGTTLNLYVNDTVVDTVVDATVPDTGTWAGFRMLANVTPSLDEFRVSSA